MKKLLLPLAISFFGFAAISLHYQRTIPQAAAEEFAQPAHDSQQQTTESGAHKSATPIELSRADLEDKLQRETRESATAQNERPGRRRSAQFVARRLAC
jgi:hypothetical protein